MPEESHLEEMREAIRSDFERLAERRGEQELLHVDEPDEAQRPELEALHDERAELDVEEEPDLDEEVEAEHRSWLARLLSP
jgi:hypothetical protein